MKILALEQEKPGLTAEDFAPHLTAEARRVWDLHEQGILREIYFDADAHTAVLMLECDDIEQAQAILDDLPLVAAGLITFDVIPLAPYTGFTRLFADD